MSRPGPRAKMSATMKRIGHKPQVRGGNGTGMTEPQARLYHALKDLGIEVKDEYGISTRTIPDWRERKYPWAYKSDLGIAEVKLSIEIDGEDHCLKKQRALDEKKTNCLNMLGWKVLRFSNQEVMENLEACVQTVTSTISKLKSTTTTSPKGA